MANPAVRLAIHTASEDASYLLIDGLRFETSWRGSFFETQGRTRQPAPQFRKSYGARAAWIRRPAVTKALTVSTNHGTVATENRLSKCRGMPLGLCGRRLPELNLVPIRVIDPGKATVGFIHSFGVDLYALLF